MSNGTVQEPALSAIDPRTQTEVHPDVVAAYANPGPGVAFWAPVGHAGPVSSAPPAGGIPEAPTDGQLYARQNANWSVVQQPGPWIPINFSGGTAAAECAYRIEPGALVDYVDRLMRNLETGEPAPMKFCLFRRWPKPKCVETLGPF